MRGWFEVGILEMSFCRQVLSTVAAAAASPRVFPFLFACIEDSLSNQQSV